GPSGTRVRGPGDRPGAVAGLPAQAAPPAGPVAVDTSSAGVPPSVHPATSADHTPRCPRTSGRLPPVRRRWHGSARRRRPTHPLGTAGRTARRSGTWVLSSLGHATPPAASPPSREVLGSSPVSGLSPLRTLPLN